jgi:predicted O-methyltransferase YrrM
MRARGSAADVGLRELCEYINDTHGQVERMAELGVWAGESTAIFIAMLAPSTLIAVDAWRSMTGRHRKNNDWRDYNSAELAFRERMRLIRERHLEGIGVDAPLSIYPPMWHLDLRKEDTVKAATDCPDHSLDLVYIDAAHDYKSVRADILAWLPKLKRGGIMAGHDYDFSTAQSRGYGVIRAVHEVFCCPDRVFRDTSWLVRPSRKRCMTGKRTWLSRRK